MTKMVRIENADSGDHFKLRVTKQHKNAEGEWVDSGEPPRDLRFPTAMCEVGIHSGVRFVIDEFNDPPKSA